MLDGSEFFECACHSFDHTLRFVLDLDEQQDEDEIAFPTLYTEIQLNHYIPWYKRIILGIKYIFGFDIHHAYTCWEINDQSDDPDRMIAMLQKLKIALDAEKKKRLEKYEKNKAKRDEISQELTEFEQKSIIDGIKNSSGYGELV